MQDKKVLIKPTGCTDWDNHGQSSDKMKKQEVWDTLGQPSGKFDYLVKYTAPEWVAASSTDSEDMYTNEQLNVQKDIQPDVETFGSMTLKRVTDVKDKFIPLNGITLDSKQQCLLDHLWHIQTINKATQYKVKMLNVLSIYFSEQKSTYKKQFTHYVIFRGTKTGLFNNFDTVRKYILCPRPVFKGYPSFSTALEAAREAFGHTFFIEPEEVKSYAQTAQQNPQDTLKQLQFKAGNLEGKLELTQQQLQKRLVQVDNLNQERLKALEEVAKREQIIERLQMENNRLHLQLKKPVNRSYEQLRARLIDLPVQYTLQPVLNQFPESIELINAKTEEEHVQILIKAQKEIVQIHFREIKYSGVQVSQESEEEPLKLSIDLNRTDMPIEKIVNFYHYGMIYSMNFFLQDEKNITQILERMGEKLLLIAGNMACTAENIYVYIQSSFPAMINLALVPARKRIFIETAGPHCTEERFERKEPTKYSHLQEKEYYKKWQRFPGYHKFTPSWRRWKLLGEGHYVQIYALQHWHMCLPFSGEGGELDIQFLFNEEDDEALRYLNSNVENNSADMEEDDITIPDTHRDY